MMKIWKVGMAVGLAMVLGGAAQATVVTLTGVDGFGTSSFNSAGLWDNGLAPSAGNDYYVPDSTRMRTPADGGSYTFAGDSLTINNTTPYGDGLMYKGTGSTGVITVDNLILDGGLISHANGSGDVFQLDGGLTVASDSRIVALQGPIYIYSDISGTAQISNEDTSGPIECKLWLGSSANTFTGDILNNGRLGLLDDANLNFVIGAPGVNNQVTNGGGTQKHVTFDGDFVFDLTGASTMLGDSWTVIDTDLNTTYYGSTFTVEDFFLVHGGVWVQQIGASSDFYEFNPGTGVLSVVPEPASFALLSLGGLALLRRRR